MNNPLEFVDSIRTPGEIWMINGHRIVGVHFKADCRGRKCVIHNPSIHHMSEFPMIYRNDRNIFERICGHGIGHPDPDQFDYWDEISDDGAGVHGCDGCCSEPDNWMPGDLQDVGYPICAKDGCNSELFPPYDEEGERCEGHTADEYGIEDADCDCSIGHSDNMDIDVCYEHMRAYRNRWEKEYLHGGEGKWATT